MIDNQIIEEAIKEIRDKNFGTTEQFLEVHEVVCDKNILRIQKEHDNAVVYFPVKNEKFYFAVHLEIEPSLLVLSTYTETYNSISLVASSEEKSLEQLKSYTKLNISHGWNKGDKKSLGNAHHKHSCIQIEPNPEPDTFENKLAKLLDLLEAHSREIQSLCEISDVFIRVIIIFHNGNTMLGGFQIKADLQKRLSA